MQSSTYWVSQTWKFPPTPSACPSVNSQGNRFPYTEVKKQCNFIVNDNVSSRHHNLFQLRAWPTVYLFFRAVFWNMHKHTCQPFKVFMPKINFTTTSFKSNSSTWASWPLVFSHFSTWPTGWPSGNWRAHCVLLLAQAHH